MKHIAPLALAAVISFSVPLSYAQNNTVTVDELKRQIDVLAGEIQKMKIGEAAADASTSSYGLGPAASKVYRTQKGVSIAGYGELLYQTFPAGRQDGSITNQGPTLNLVRAVTYAGYRFDNSWLFNSEFEFEHSPGEGQEVGIEFAYLDKLWKQEFNFRAGLLLIPMGWVNELHEPTVFLGTRRPRTEDLLIPTTWTEIGFGGFGTIGAFAYRSYVVAGLDATQFQSDEPGIRVGRRQTGSENVRTFASVTRLDFQGIQSLILGASAYVGKANTALDPALGGNMSVPMGIFDLHFDYKLGALHLRGLGVANFMGDSGALNTALGRTEPSTVIAGRQYGGYLEAGYDVFSGKFDQQALIPFGRVEAFDTQAAIPSGFTRDAASTVKVVTVGLNYKPIDQIIFKTDYNWQLQGDRKGLNQYNLSAGYVF